MDKFLYNIRKYGDGTMYIFAEFIDTTTKYKNGKPRHITTSMKFTFELQKAMIKTH